MIINILYNYSNACLGQSRIFASTTIFERYDIEHYLRQYMNSMTIDRIELRKSTKVSLLLSLYVIWFDFIQQYTIQWFYVEHYYIYSQGFHKKQINPAYFHCGPFGMGYLQDSWLVLRLIIIVHIIEQHIK